MSEPREAARVLPITQPVDEAGSDVRLVVRSDLPRTGSVDGVWWPRSRDLRAELPSLVAALDAQLGRRIGAILRVGFGVDEWDAAGRARLVTPTGRVVLAGWRHFTPDVVWVASHATALAPIVLRVVPPETPEREALTALDGAGAPENTDRPLLGHDDSTPLGRSLRDGGGRDRAADPAGARGAAVR